jgi:hypothetical protein
MFRWFCLKIGGFTLTKKKDGITTLCLDNIISDYIKWEKLCVKLSFNSYYEIILYIDDKIYTNVCSVQEKLVSLKG